MPGRSRAALAALAALAGSVALLIGAAAIGVRKQLIVVTVHGSSMEPTYHDGERLLARRIKPHGLSRSQVVVLLADELAGLARPPDTGPIPRWLLIKRVTAVAGDEVPACVAAARPELAGAVVPEGYLIVLGDNPQDSYDSRHEGMVRADRVQAVAMGGRLRSTLPQKRS